MRRILTNPVWERLEPLVQAAKRSPAGAKGDLPERAFLEAVIYRARTGVPWRDLPAEFGDWNAVYQRAKRWRLSGVWERLFALVPPDSPVLEARQLLAEQAGVSPQRDEGGKASRPRKRPGGRPGKGPRST